MIALSSEIGEEIVLSDDGDSSKAIRVLIADHDEALLACYRESLEAAGFSVRTATEAVEFLTKLRRWVPDVIVLEPYLPGGASRRVVRALRRCAHTPPIPVFIHGSQANAPARLEFPICGYEVRPLRPEQLAQRLREVLRRFKSLSARKGRQTSALPAKACR